MLKWKKVRPIYPTDHIISSKARELGARGFTPQYEKGPNDNMQFIMSNEYMRLWFKERELYQKENYAKQESTKNDVKLKRGFVQRMAVCAKLKQKELPVIHLKRFQNAIPKISNRKTDEEKTKTCEKYKKAIEPTIIIERYKPGFPATAFRPTNSDATNITLKNTSTFSKTKKTTKTKIKTKEDPSKTNCAFVIKIK